MNIYGLFPVLITEKTTSEHEIFKDMFLKNIFRYLSPEGKSSEFTGHVNIHKDVEFTKFFEFVVSNIKDYISSLKIDPEIFNYALVKSWFNITKNSDNPSHNHQDAHISFTYYINTPKNISKDFVVYNTKETNSLYPGMLRLNKISEYNLFNSSTWRIPVHEGKIIVFPSTLQHSVMSVDHYNPVVVDEPGCKNIEDLTSSRIVIAGDFILTYKNKSNAYLGLQPMSNWSVW